MRGMRPHEELLWQMSGKLPVSKRQKLDPFSCVPQQGPFTNVPHPELYAVEPSVGRCAVVMQSPLVPRYLQDEYMDLVCLGSTIDPEPNPPPEQITEPQPVLLLLGCLLGIPQVGTKNVVVPS